MLMAEAFFVSSIDVEREVGSIRAAASIIWGERGRRSRLLSRTVFCLSTDQQARVSGVIFPRGDA